MGDEMDPCECMWSQEMAMRRLISLLRQGQSYCTDSDCIDELPGLPPAPTGASDGFLMLFFTMALVLAMQAFQWRRNRLPRLEAEDVSKPLRNPEDHDRGDGAPPTPPRI